MQKLFFIFIITVIGSCKSQTTSGKESSIKATDYPDLALSVKTLDFPTFSISVPSAWKPAYDDTLSKVADMTARNRILLPNGNLAHIVHGNSAWDISEDYLQVNSYFSEVAGCKAKVFDNKAEKLMGVYIDSAGTMQPIGSYGFLLYVKDLDSVYYSDLTQAIKTIRLKSL